MSEHGIEGAVLWRGDDGYEEARLAAVWNERKPDRHPDVIVRATSADDVAAAVRLAAARGLKVKARGGGHSWTASSVRDGMLIDCSALDSISFQPATGTAWVGPGVRGRDLNNVLEQHGLFFPSGHCPSVGIGGFLLQGGWGWNSRAVGPACMSVEAIDVVTADGELIRADAELNADWLWAARGAGSGYFGIVTAFEVRCHPRPTAIYSRTDVYSLDDADELLRWAMEFEPTLPAEFEFAIMGTTPTLPDGRTVHDGTALMVMCNVLMHDDDEALTAIRRLDECPLRDRALMIGEITPSDFTALYDGPDSVEPEGVRWAVDNVWTDAGADEVVPLATAILRDMRTPESHLFWYTWRPQPLEDAAISVQARLYLAAFAGWHDPARDEELTRWPVEHMDRLQHISEGIQLADENLLARPDARYMTEENAARLEELRRRHDPEGRFHGFLVPEPA
ncbi:MAG TPA: FAD-binding oxidoreductase [Solirubrobacteraceae bacterium]|nr:FAD-binding oxidoreductase [Solirubrobacteraceae bacterium]